MEWKPVTGGKERKIRLISHSCGGLWAIGDNDNIFYRTGTFENPQSIGDDWYQVEGKLKQLSVGYNVVWGVDKLGQVWYRDGMDIEHHVGTKWVNVPTDGPFKQVSVDRMGHLWALDAKNDVYIRFGACLDQKAGLFWRKVDYHRMSQLDVGKCGVWAVDENNEIFYREGTYGENGSDGSHWVKVGPGSVLLHHVSSGGEDLLLGVTAKRELYMRVGMCGQMTTGTDWKKMKGDLLTVDVYGYSAWGVDSNMETVFTDLWPQNEAPMRMLRDSFY